MSKVHEAMQGIRDTLGVIKKVKKGGLPYAVVGINQVLARVNPLLMQYQLTVSPTHIDVLSTETLSIGNKPWVHVVCLVTWEWRSAEDGSVLVTQSLGEGLDNAGKATSKAQTYAQRYALLTALGIQTEEVRDPELIEHAEQKRASRKKVKTKSGRDPFALSVDELRVEIGRIGNLVDLRKTEGWLAKENKEAYEALRGDIKARAEFLRDDVSF
jgi:hypothetical protein